MLTWQRLVEIEPKLIAFERAGKEAAGNGWAGWLEWIGGKGLLRALVGPDARCPELRVPEAVDLVVDHLASVHRRAMKRGRLKLEEYR